MKCCACNEEITNEYDAVCVNADGDFVCDLNCKHFYDDGRDEFFDNIGNDEWYGKYI